MKIEQLTSTRFIAALSIVIYHYGKQISPFSNSYISTIVEHLNIGVSYFFVLSGFVMVIAHSRNGALRHVSEVDYYKKRFFRIYPVYFFALLLTVLFQNSNWSLVNFLLSLTLLQSWVPGHALSLNSPGWSLSVELLFYMLFPLLVNRFYIRLSKSSILLSVNIFWIVSMIVLYGLLRYYSNHSGAFLRQLIFYFPLSHLNEFLIGMLGGFFFIKGLKKANYDFFILVIFFLFILGISFNISDLYHNGLFAIVFIFLIILISLNTGSITSILTNKYFVFLGDSSYALYILQFPVFICSTYLLDTLSITNIQIRFYFFIAFLILTSCISFQYLEKPIFNWSKRRFLSPTVD